MTAQIENKLEKYSIKVEQDDLSFNPREFCDNFCKLVFTGKYDYLGDKHSVNFDDEFFESRFDFMERGAEIVKKNFKDAVIVKSVHLYEHSGMTISTKFEYPYNCRWDSGTVGFAVVTKQDIRDNYMVKRVTKKYLKKAEELMEAEIKTLDAYIRGDVYFFTITDENGEVVDSCGGYYDYDECKREAEGILEHIKNSQKQ